MYGIDFRASNNILWQGNNFRLIGFMFRKVSYCSGGGGGGGGGGGEGGKKLITNYVCISQREKY